VKIAARATVIFGVFFLAQYFKGRKFVLVFQRLLIMMFIALKPCAIWFFAEQPLLLSIFLPLFLFEINIILK